MTKDNEATPPVYPCDDEDSRDTSIVESESEENLDYDVDDDDDSSEDDRNNLKQTTNKKSRNVLKRKAKSGKHE